MPHSVSQLLHTFGHSPTYNEDVVHMYTHALGLCPTGPFFQNYSRLGQSPKVNFWELLWQNFYRPDALPVTQPTA